MIFKIAKKKLTPERGLHVPIWPTGSNDLCFISLIAKKCSDSGKFEQRSLQILCARQTWKQSLASNYHCENSFSLMYSLGDTVICCQRK